MEYPFESRTKVKMLSDVLLMTCKELIDDAKEGCTDLVFKDICLEILARARQVLNDAKFKELSFYAAQKIKEKSSLREANLPI